MTAMTHRPTSEATVPDRARDEHPVSSLRAVVPTPERVGTTVGAAYGLVALSSSAVAVVLPTIRSEYAIGLATAGWVITAFVVALAASAPIYGYVADRIGARTPVTVGLVVMAVGAAIAAAAPNIGILVAARALQGAGAGAVPVLAPAIIAARTSNDDRPRALARMSALAAAAAAGLLIGAMLAELVGWRPVAALPVLAAGLIGPIRHLADRHESSGGPVHYAGAAAVAAIAVGINLTLQVRSAPTTAAVGAGLVVVGVIAATISWPRTRAPFIPTSVLANTIGWRLGIAAAAIPASYFALLIAIPTILAERHDMSRLAIGALLFPAALAGAFVGPLARRLRTRLTGPIVGAVGIAASALALAIVAASPGRPAGLTAAFALAAISFGLGQSALLNEITTTTPEQQRGAALSLFMVTFFVGGGLGGATLTALADTTSINAAAGWLALAPLAAAALAATTRTGNTTR